MIAIKLSKAELQERKTITVSPLGKISSCFSIMSVAKRSIKKEMGGLQLSNRGRNQPENDSNLPKEN